jgi:hypothetical protein
MNLTSLETTTITVLNLVKLPNMSLMANLSCNIVERQPAQKWHKDRKGRKLEFEHILYYQKIIVALTETDRLMKEIDQVEIE